MQYAKVNPIVQILFPLLVAENYSGLGPGTLVSENAGPGFGFEKMRH